MINVVFLLFQKPSFEPWFVGYLDKRGEIAIQSEYKALSGSSDPGKVPFEKAKKIVERDRGNPVAWKLLIDVGYLNHRLYDVADTVANVNSINLRRGESDGLRQSQYYAINVLRGKFAYFGGQIGTSERWDQIVDKYPQFGKEMVLNLKETPPFNVCLVTLDLSDQSPETMLGFLKRIENQYPHRYETEYFKSYIMRVNATLVGNHGKETIVNRYNPEEYNKHLHKMQEKWPNEATPYYLLMLAYKGIDKEKETQYAKQYLNLEKRSFRVSWLRNAKASINK